MFKTGSKSGQKDKKSDQGKVSAGHQPFLQLVLTCLRELDSGTDKKTDKEEQKENLLQSLHSQLSTYLFFTKDDKFHNYEDCSARKTMQDALQLRFSLLGGVFDTICRNCTSVTEWCTLLVQLIVKGVIDLTNNSDIFTTLLGKYAAQMPSKCSQTAVKMQSFSLNLVSQIFKFFLYKFQI